VLSFAIPRGMAGFVKKPLETGKGKNHNTSPKKITSILLEYKCRTTKSD
jgi:hypothetical protein